MKKHMFNHNDLNQIMARGMTQEQVMLQLEMFKKEASYAKLDRPCTIGDGIRVLKKDEIQKLTLLHKDGASKGRLLKFVPASGAASRMFKFLLQLKETDPAFHRDNFLKKAEEHDKQAKEIISFMDGIRQFAFFDGLETHMDNSGIDMETHIQQGLFQDIIDSLLGSQGLGYSDIPKGLIKFHKYHEGSRTAFEEHLMEAIDYIQDEQGICRLHFSVSSEHRRRFEELLKEVAPHYEQKHNVTFQVKFSLQKSSTDTIAVEMNNRPFRNKQGNLLFRPGGHGALIENLNDMKGDIIYIKNIDNVVQDRLKGPTFFWKKVLAGCLIKTQLMVFGYLERLAEGKPDRGFIDQLMDFAKQSLCIPPLSDWSVMSLTDKMKFLYEKLNRPIRICGMVLNEGEPGGGPFWVKGKDGCESLQIVESVQVDPQSDEQQAILASSTHFNPVDIVCGVRNYKGDPFDLKNFVDTDAVFISRKSQGGQDLKALELPGLWNGAMSDWITVFVEVPIVTFNPVKTVNDLLRKEHQPA